jgi:hypothetical protein
MSVETPSNARSNSPGCVATVVEIRPKNDSSPISKVVLLLKILGVSGFQKPTQKRSETTSSS